MRLSFQPVQVIWALWSSSAVFYRRAFLKRRESGSKPKSWQLDEDRLAAAVLDSRAAHARCCTGSYFKQPPAPAPKDLM